MKTVNIEVSGKTQADIEDAVREVLRLIEQGYGSGASSNEDGEFSFESSGEYGSEEDERDSWLDTPERKP